MIVSVLAQEAGGWIQKYDDFCSKHLLTSSPFDLRKSLCFRIQCLIQPVAWMWRGLIRRVALL
jgi:hypothetical protein